MGNDKSKVSGPVSSGGTHSLQTGRPKHSIHGLRCSCVLATVFIALLLLPVTAEILFHTASIPMHEAPMHEAATETDSHKLRQPSMPRSRWSGEWRMPMTARPIVPRSITLHSNFKPDLSDVISRARPLLC